MQKNALEKLNQVNDMVLARETVPADYLRYLPDDLAELVEEYNGRTGELCENDPSLSYPLYVEGGGSYGMWALPSHFYQDRDVQEIQDYLRLVEQLLDAFDAARETKV